MYFFDLLPVELGDYKGYRNRLHLCTVPGQIALDKTRRLVLRHVDGVVFVVDSQRAALPGNVESILNLETNLVRQGDDPRRVPLVVQYNKRDLPDVLAVDELHEALRVPDGVPELEACARTGQGVGETLKAVVKACLTLIGDPRDLREGHSPSLLPGIRPSMYPDLVPPAMSTPVFPKPPPVPQSLRHAPPRRRDLHAEPAAPLAARAAGKPSR